MKYSDVKLVPLKSHKFKVIEDIEIKECNVTIPKGFRSDGASVPRIFWSIFPPNRTDYLPCAILHDYYCDLEEFKQADICFEKCLKELKVRKIDRILILTAVKLYHKIRYGVKFSNE